MVENSDSDQQLNKLSSGIIGAAIEVHRVLCPGLLESAYEECLARELEEKGMCYERQKPIPVLYKGKTIDCSYRADLIVEDKVLLELKAVESILPIHEAQLLTYLKLTGIKLGLMINFNTKLLKNGIKRMRV